MNLRTIIVVVIIGIIGAISISAYLKNNELLPFPQLAMNQQDIESMRQHLMQSLREVQGSIQDIFVTSEGIKVLTIQVQIPDITVMKIPSQKELPISQKTIRVSITKKTVTEEEEAFKVGDTVTTLLDRGVYEGSDFNALKISLYSREREIKKTIEYSNIIHGTIKSIGNNSLVLKADVPDLAKMATLDVSQSFVVPRITKNYTVVINKNTDLSGTRIKDLKINDGLTAWGNENLLTENSFTATRIRKEQ